MPSLYLTRSGTSSQWSSACISCVRPRSNFRLSLTTRAWTGEIAGVEYEIFNSEALRSIIFSESNNGGSPLAHNPAPCAVCYVGGRSTILMIPKNTVSGRLSTPDILFLRILEPRPVFIFAAATFVWTRHLRSQLVEQTKTKDCSTLFKSSVDHCHVPSIPLVERWPVSFALNDVLDKKSGTKGNFVFCNNR